MSEGKGNGSRPACRKGNGGQKSFVFFHHFAHRNDMLKIKIFVLTIIAIDIFLQNMNKGFNDYGSYGGGGGGPPMEVSFRYCV